MSGRGRSPGGRSFGRGDRGGGRFGGGGGRDGGGRYVFLYMQKKLQQTIEYI